MTVKGKRSWGVRRVEAKKMGLAGTTGTKVLRDRRYLKIKRREGGFIGARFKKLLRLLSGLDKELWGQRGGRKPSASFDTQRDEGDNDG